MVRKLSVSKLFILLCFFIIEESKFVRLFAQNIEQTLLDDRWKAAWIAVPGILPNGYGVYCFRKRFTLATKPEKFVIHVSADNRYKLFVNETLVSLGPARGDLSHWNYETVDIASYLKAGKNIIAAQVWNEGEHRPEGQITYRTGFILQGAGTEAAILNTDDSWKCKKDASYAPLNVNLRTYYVAGSGEIRNMALSLGQWKSEEYDDTQWQKAQKLMPGTPRNLQGAFGTPFGWRLVPSSLPQMELTKERLEKLVKNESGIIIPDNFPASKQSLQIPANTTVQLILDQTHLTNAYPTIEWSGGKNATIAVTYAEALYTKYPIKSNRNDVDGKVLIGRKDSLISDGSPNQYFSPLTFRTFRYVQLTLRTQQEPLILNDIYSTFTGFPFQLKASINSQNPEINTMLNIGWRTARLCAYETYMDCPYYEQLQYIGDARIQALVSLYNTGDDRLLKNALNLMDYSREAEGLTSSRHPSYTIQYIPTFSLWYIGMLHDYSKYGQDTDFVKHKISGVRQILAFFNTYQEKDGSLKNVPQWMFTDWVDKRTGWINGIGPVGKDGYSAVLDLQLLLAYQTAVELEKKLGIPAMATHYQQSIDLLKKNIRAKYWDNVTQLIADRTEKDVFSQHSNALAILTGIIRKEELPHVAQAILTNDKLAPASIYFKYYVHQALIKAGLGNDYLKWLDKWRENIHLGLTTWAETSDLENTRSDCHAWGASPNIEFYRTLLGIDSEDLGFKSIKIEPHLGDIQKISGEMPHPNGVIKIYYELKQNQLYAQIALPAGTQGRLVWKNNNYPLKSGNNTLTIP